ncbi:hypothetical protein CICLE_v10023632mg [Citrus x clementina]|uniref:3-oxoacyl-[acyl-carrier-protein] reductase n=1 Tax=Citrus clementina TaxID=85681 RepID=V4TT91_CITCL|nr:hypothetical protein CICLE_v10023632mg [Citrus x clementina]
MAAATSTKPSLESLPLQGRVAMVTGASRGIGRGIALRLASLGAKVVINYSSNSVQAEVVAEEINSASPEKQSTPLAITFKANVSDESQVKALFDIAETEFNSQANYGFRVNARGTFLCCKEAANKLKRGGRGRIILLSSSVVVSLRPNYASYAASKAAMETMAKILAKELRGTSITVNCVAPGPIATYMLFSGRSQDNIMGLIEACPMGRLGVTMDVAKIVGFLASDDREWVYGQIIGTSGGLVVK